MLTGENGIITQAQRAKNETENAARQEEMDLAEIEAAITGKDVPIVQVHDDNPGELEQENNTTFVINSIEDLVFFSYDVTTNGNTYQNQTVKLGTNLDFSSDKSYVNPNRTDFAQYGYNGPLKQALTSGTGFNPIGNQERTNSFYGTFDGNNNAICSLYINMNSDENLVAGLFTENYGEIKNIGLVDTNITVQGEANTIVGGIVGVNFNNIYNSYVSGSINVIGIKNGDKTTDTELFRIGGIIGIQGSDSEIENVFNIGKVTSTNSSTDLRVGGITGGIANNATNTSINNAYNTGSIEANGLSSSQVGSIAGSNLITLSNCFYLVGTYDVGVGGSGASTGVTEWESIDKFPSVLSVVNGDDVFKEDTKGINNGYPILEWQ